MAIPVPHPAAGQQDGKATTGAIAIILDQSQGVLRLGVQNDFIVVRVVATLMRVVHDTPRNAQAPPLLRNVIRLAQLGGYLARANDPPPGNTVMWRGIRRLTDIQI